jgi:hypothetical protein
MPVVGNSVALDFNIYACQSNRYRVIMKITSHLAPCDLYMVIAMRDLSPCMSHLISDLFAKSHKNK